MSYTVVQAPVSCAIKYNKCCNKINVLFCFITAEKNNLAIKYFCTCCNNRATAWEIVSAFISFYFIADVRTTALK